MLRGEQVSFQGKNSDSLLKNPDFLVETPDFLVENVDFIIKNSTAGPRITSGNGKAFFPSAI